MKIWIPILALFLTLTSSRSEEPRPNILLIVSEDNGPELGCYGEPSVKTPHLDQLASKGIRYNRAFVPQAGCSQSRAALLTGLYPHQNGQIGLATWKFRLYDETCPNLVRSLKAAGYRTGIIGKLHINPASAFPFDFEAIPSSNFGRKRMANYAKEAKTFFEASDEPFFLSVNFPDAHRPFTPQVGGVPENPLTAKDVKPLASFGIDTPDLRKQTANYYNCINRLDSQVGELLATLRDTGKLDHTLIVYMGDHGADMLRGKRTSYEGGLRVPLIMSWPGEVESGQVSEELVSTLDLMPTFLDVAKAKPVENLPGRSLLTSPKGWRQYLFTEYHIHSAHNYFPQRTVRDDRYKLIQNLMPGTVNPGYAFTNEKFFSGLEETIAKAPEPIKGAYLRMERPAEFELYDLSKDPYEFVDLSTEPAHKETLTRLQKELQTWREESNDPLLKADNIVRLKEELDACFVNGQPSKSKLNLTYPDYFLSSSRQAPKKKNVLFIAIDDLRPALGCYGDKTAITPNIDRLAARGTVFTRAYCQEAVCAPSRLSLLSGMRPDTIQVWDLGTHFREARPDLVSLPQHFKNNGYHTQSLGKIFHGGGKPSKDPLSWSAPPVFDTGHDPKLRYANPENLAGKGLKRASFEAGNTLDDYYIDGKICKESLQALEQLGKSGKPFFLAVGFKKPHLPFCAPKKYWDLYDRKAIPHPSTTTHPKGSPELAWRSWMELEGYSDIPADGVLSSEKVQLLRHGYYACVSYIDAQVGRLLDQLDALDLSKNTVICLWGDHGFHLGEQGLWTKANNYELSTRVPLIFVDPDQSGRAQKTNALVELVDLYPTLAESCGLDAPIEGEGTSFVPLLKNPELEWKTAAFSQYPRARKGNRHRRHGDIMGYTVRSKDYRYVEWREWQTGEIAAVELYDQISDPDEMRNIAGLPMSAEILTQHQTILKNGWQGALPPKPSAKNETWNLPEPQKKLTENLACNCVIGEGPFNIEAKISLAEINGTAASVRIGKGINFGFDGRTKQIFVEGKLVGKTRSVAKSADHLEAGKPFHFFARRDKENKLEIGIEKAVLYSLPDATHKIGSVIFRPHRNQMDVLSVHIAGDVLPGPKPRPFVVIHSTGQFDCHTTRIPGIARANDGTLLAVYDLRYNSRKDLQEHMDIGLSRSTDGGKTWEAPRPIMDMGELGGLPQKQNGCSDPNILVDTKTGKIFVSAVWTHGKPGTHQWRGNGSEPGLDYKKTSQFLVVRSSDNGVTWSKPENWTSKLKRPEWYLFAPAPGNGITTKDGTLVMPTQGRDKNGIPFSNLMWSRDRGKNWTVSPQARSNTTECAVAELSDGSLMLNMRDNRNRSDKSDTNGRAVGVTSDYGKTWHAHPSDHGALPEPVCMASLISHTLKDGRQVLFFSNPNSKTARENMTVKVSLDDGKSWPKNRQIVLDLQGGAYSSLVMIDDETLGILYESSRANLVFQTIAIKEFGL